MFTTPLTRILLLLLLLIALPLSAEEIKDVTFTMSGEREESVAFSFEGKKVGAGRKGFQAVVDRVSKLPSGTSIVWGPDYDRCGACSGAEFTPREGYPMLWAELEEQVRTRGLTLSSSYPGPFVRSAKRTARKGDADFNISWQNYRGPKTKHEEVLYLANGEYLGRGDDALMALLARLRKLPAGSTVSMPRYEYSGRWVSEAEDKDALIARNETLAELTPFKERRAEFHAVIAKQKLKLGYEYHSPKRNAVSVMDWSAGDRYAIAIASFGRIVRNDEKPSAAAVVLGWKDYEAGLQRSDDGKHRPRRSEITATYTLNEEPLGKGVPAFAQAMERLAELPAGSVVQVRVCLRTKGRFLCPLVYDNQRHFERTGFEPYAGMFPWLLAIAREHELQIEWLPDEGKSCQDCELNK